MVKNKLQFLEKDILDDYLICYHEKFQNSKIMTILKNSRGLKYLLANSKTNQKEIVNFINYWIIGEVKLMFLRAQRAALIKK